MKQRLGSLGGQLGIGLALLGFLLIFLGWNGAGSYDDVPAQFPYLISGGIAGLALVVLGAAFVVVDNQRRDRAEVQASLAELRDALDRLAGATASLSGLGGVGDCGDPCPWGAKGPCVSPPSGGGAPGKPQPRSR